MGLGEPRHASPLRTVAGVTIDEIATDASLGQVTDLLRMLMMDNDNIVAAAYWKCGAMMCLDPSYGMAAAHLQIVKLQHLTLRRLHREAVFVIAANGNNGFNSLAICGSVAT